MWNSRTESELEKTQRELNAKLKLIKECCVLRTENEKLKEALEEIVNYQVWRFKLLPHKNELLEEVVDIAHEALKEVKG